MPSTYTPLGTTKLTTAASSYTFNSFSSAYTDLRLVVVARSTLNGGTGGGADQVGLQFNGITTTTYSITQLFGSGTSAATGVQTNQTSLGIGNIPVGDSIVSPSFQMVVADIMQYSNPSIFKSVYGISGPSGDYSLHRMGTWRSTSAITSVTVLSSGGNQWAVGTTLTLYGIKAA
jgi:hypothetical protein